MDHDWRSSPGQKAAGTRPEELGAGSAPTLAPGSDIPSTIEAALDTLLDCSGEVLAHVSSVELAVEYASFGLSHYAVADPLGWSEQKIAELLPRKDALGDYLEQLPPGTRLAQVLAAIDPEKVDDFSLVELVAAHKRMESWSAAKAAEAAAVLAERPALTPTWPGTVPGRTRGECIVGEELAMRLRISRLTATRLAACGRAFAGMFQPTGEALELGLIDFPRAQAIFTALDGLPAEVAMAAQWEVLDKAPGRTLRQVQQDLAKAVIAVDPDDADTRHRAARKQRRVNRPRPLPDGMAHVSAVLPAVDAIALDTAVEAAARAAKHNGSSRTLDQLRADSLALMGHAALELGRIGPHAEAHCSCAATPPAAGGVPAPAPDGPAPPPSAAVADEPPRPEHRLSGGRLPTIRLGRLGGGRADIRITVPLGVMLPDPEAPFRHALERDPEPVAELEGYGPIPPEVARALAAGGVWRRLVTDPTGTEVLDVGRTRYQPTAAIADHVRERDRTCIRPGCSTPARSCDLDHRHEWQDGGETSAENIAPLCRRDHPVKTIGAFTVARASDGTYAWTTPTGHGYLRRRDGSVRTLSRQMAEGLRAAGQELTRSGRSIGAEQVDAILAAVAAGSDGDGRWTPPRALATFLTDDGVGPGWTTDDEPPF